nr:MAG TPA: endonuclease VIII-like protein [Herelleviridae sp.]
MPTNYCLYCYFGVNSQSIVNYNKKTIWFIFNNIIYFRT